MSPQGQDWRSFTKQTHNLKVVGSNPTPATKKSPQFQRNKESFLSAPMMMFLHRKHTESELKPNRDTTSRSLRVGVEIQTGARATVRSSRGSGLVATLHLACKSNSRRFGHGRSPAKHGRTAVPKTFDRGCPFVFGRSAGGSQSRWFSASCTSPVFPPRRQRCRSV